MGFKSWIRGLFEEPTPPNIPVENSKVENNATAGIRQSPFTAYSQSLINSEMRTIRSNVANMFAPLNALAQEAVNRNIYPLDRQGNKCYDNRVWQILQHPNIDMDFKTFIKDLLYGYIANSEVNILMWNNKFGVNQVGYEGIEFISGLTILPTGAKRNTMDTIQYQVRGADGGIMTVGEDCVMSLKYSLDPTEMISVSPGSASGEAAKIQDAMNMQLRAYFNNNATPQTIVTIHAPTSQEFNAIKQDYEMRNRGAANSYGTMYQHVVDDGILGNGNPRIDVQVIGANGENLDVTGISEFVTKQINSNLGVSPLIYGDTDAVSYQNQEVVNDKFNRRVKNTLEEFLSKLCFELNRVTGGIGFIFGFEYAETEFAEKRLVQAQTTVQLTQAFATLINLGVDSDTAASAINAGDSWLGLNAMKATQPAPQAPQAANTVAKPANLINNITLSKDMAEQVEQNKTTGATTKVAKRQETESETIKKILHDMSMKHVERMKQGSKVNALAPQDSKYVNELLAQLQRIADNGGVTVARQLAQQIQGTAINTSYEVSGKALEELTDRANHVISDYADYLDTNINDMQEKSQEDDAPSFSDMVGDFVKGAMLSKIADITLNETKYAFQSGQNDNAEDINEALGDSANIVKRWQTTSSNVCEFCAAMNGVEAGVQDAFITDGVIRASDGSTLVLDDDFNDGTLPDAHVNCECVFTFGVEDK